MKRSNNEPNARCWGMNPTHTPSSAPTKEPSSHPSNNPSSNPTSEPSKNPSAIPTLCPTSNPSKAPSKEPSSHPSNNPSSNPTSEPSNNPSNLTYGNGLQAMHKKFFALRGQNWFFWILRGPLAQSFDPHFNFMGIFYKNLPNKMTLYPATTSQIRRETCFAST